MGSKRASPGKGMVWRTSSEEGATSWRAIAKNMEVIELQAGIAERFDAWGRSIGVVQAGVVPSKICQHAVVGSRGSGNWLYHRQRLPKC